MPQRQPSAWEYLSSDTKRFSSNEILRSGLYPKSHSPPQLTSTCCLTTPRGSRTRVFQRLSRRQECLTLENTIPLERLGFISKQHLIVSYFSKKKKTFTEEKFLLCETIVGLSKNCFSLLEQKYSHFFPIC